MARPPPRKAKRPRGAYTQALRLIKIYDYLAQGGRVRPKELAQKLGLAVRTVQRDLKILGQAVDDLESDDRDGKVEYRLATRARSSFLHLRHAVAIALGARLIDFLAGPGLAVDITPVVDDLRLQLKTPDRRRFDAWSRRVVVIAPAQRTYRDRDLLKTFDAILRAMLELWPVWVSYLSPSRARAGHPARRLRIHPLGLAFHRDGVYFIVDIVDGDWEADAPRRIQLALDRIRSVDDLDRDPKNRFTLPDDFDASAFFGDAFGIWRDGEALAVVLCVDPDYAPFVEERKLHHSQSIDQQSDGSLIVRMQVEGLHEVAQWILSAGEHVEVLEPPRLRELVRGRLARALANYDDRGAT